MLQVSGWSSDLQMLSTRVQCLDLQLPSYDEAFNDSGNISLYGQTADDQGPDYKKILRLSYDVIITYDNRKSNLR